MSDLQQLEQKMDRLTVLVECLLWAFGEFSQTGETLHEVAGCAYGRTDQVRTYLLLYPAAGQTQEAVCRIYEEDFDKLPGFINTAVPEAAQDGNPTRDQARWQGIYIHTPAFTITTLAGQDEQMGPKARFSRVVEVPAGSDGSEQRQPAGRLKPEPDFGNHRWAVEGPTPPTPSPVGQGRRTAGKRQNQKTAGNGAGSGRRSQTAENPPVVNSAEHWRREARTATEPLMFDTAVSRLEPWFKDATAAGAFRETLFESWQPELVGFYLEALLRYAQVRKVLDGRHPTQGAHIKAKLESHTPIPAVLYQRLSIDWVEVENRPPPPLASGMGGRPEHWLNLLLAPFSPGR